jgi:hypothetical protein
MSIDSDHYSGLAERRTLQQRKEDEHFDNLLDANDAEIKAEQPLAPHRESRYSRGQRELKDIAAWDKLPTQDQVHAKHYRCARFGHVHALGPDVHPDCAWCGAELLAPGEYEKLYKMAKKVAKVQKVTKKKGKEKS